MECVVGRRVKISLDDGSNIDGFVHSCSANTGKISLEKVECVENGKKKKLVGLQHYFAEEITNIVITEDVSNKNKKKTKAAESGGYGGMLRGKCEVPHLNKLKFIDPSSLVLKNKRRDDLLTSSGNETGGSDSDIDVLPQSDDYTIIPKLCNTFYEAVTYIQKHQVVAVAMEGIAIGRFGRLCWLQIAVPGHVFMFDVLQMGRSCFEEGIKDILENEGILKILHDCRMVSDLLHHQYHINLINVFDTQVANVFVYRLRHHNDWPRYVDGLGSSLVQHLDLSMEEVNWAVVRECRKEADEEVWTERPPQRHLVEAAVKNVKHLIDLRRVLTEKMMEEFVAGVNIYLMHVRDSSDVDTKRYQTTPHLLPVAFQDIHAFMSSYIGRNPHFDTSHVPKDMNGFRQNCSRIVQPDVYFSKDSLWHGGSKETGVKGHRYASSIPKTQVPSQESSTTSAAEKPPEHSCVISEATNDTVVPTRRNIHTSIDSETVNPTRRHTSKDSETGNPTLRNNRATQDNETVNPTHRHTSKDSETVNPTRRNIRMTQNSETVNPTLRNIHTPQDNDTINPTRRNIHTPQDSDLVTQTVAKMNAAKLTEEYQKCQSERSGTNLDRLPAAPGNQISARELDIGELSGGSLMRALIHEQDATGNEAKADIDRFTIIPAGRKTNNADRKNNATSSIESHYSMIPAVAQTRNTLRSVIPGGDLVTHLPSPSQAELTKQEPLLAENMKRSPQTGVYGHTKSDTRRDCYLSDTETVFHRKSSQEVTNRLRDQLHGKSSGYSYSSDTGLTSSYDGQVEETIHESHDIHKQDSHSQSDKTPPTSLPSQPNSKLKNLLDKLKQQTQ